MRPELWRRVEELFHAALERPQEGRRAFLDQACGADAELRRQVGQLVSVDEQAGSLLEDPVLANAAATLARGGSLVGRQCGPYRILSLLGQGGMGEVYRALDGKLGRDVAIKTLPPQFALDTERLARFRREARTLASLNHPNIAAIYGLEESGEVDCLVLELVEGENLHGPLPIARALEYAGQVADALQAAHLKRIIHRDLKPANVKVTPEGRVKVLDFGLAKAMWGPQSREQFPPFSAPTDTDTIAGHVVGTPGYMSPEQARGTEVDQQADIWAFGCLLYELLAGKRAFAGETIGDTIAAVLEREPEWQSLPAKTPPKIRELLRKCLQKDAARRLSSIADARAVIKREQRGRNRWQLVAIGAVALVALVVGAAMSFRDRSLTTDHSQWVPVTKFPDSVSQPALSPDGRMLAFVRGPRTDYGLGQIYVKELPDGEPVQLTHDNLRKEGVAFSPDGTRIAYTIVDPEFNWDTWVVPAKGGEPRAWMRNATGLTWTRQRMILFSEIKPRYPMGIVTAGEDRNSEHDVYLPRNARGMATRSQASPDGKWVLVSEMSAYGNWDRCRLVPMDGSSPGRQVGPAGAPCSFGAWSPDGKWMYLTSRAGGLDHIWRQRFPDGRLEQFTSGVTEENGIAVAPDGRSLITAVAMQSSTLWIHDARGERQISILEGNAADPRFSPDGKKLYYRVVTAVQIVGTKRDPGELWVADLESGRSERVAPGVRPLEYDLSRDGKQVAMDIAGADGMPRLWVAPADGSSPPRRIPNADGQNPTFSPDGEIFFRRLEGVSSFVYRIRPDGTGLRKAIDQPAFYSGLISPDGKWIRIWGPLPGNLSAAVQLVPLAGGQPIVIGSNAVAEWSSSGDSLWISAGAVPDGRSYVIPLSRRGLLPRIPEGGFHSEQEVAALPGARRLDVVGAPGPSRDIYAFERHTLQRNLYRIPIP